MLRSQFPFFFSNKKLYRLIKFLLHGVVAFGEFIVRVGAKTGRNCEVLKGGLVVSKLRYTFFVDVGHCGAFDLLGCNQMLGILFYKEFSCL